MKIQINNVGGPSAGMMFALGIIDKMSPGDLTAASTSRGTGTIDDVANVGGIGWHPSEALRGARTPARLVPRPAVELQRGGRARAQWHRVFAVSKLQDSLTVLQTIRDGGDLDALRRATGRPPPHPEGIVVSTAYPQRPTPRWTRDHDLSAEPGHAPEPFTRIISITLAVIAAWSSRSSSSRTSTPTGCGSRSWDSRGVDHPVDRAHGDVRRGLPRHGGCRLWGVIQLARTACVRTRGLSSQLDRYQEVVETAAASGDVGHPDLLRLLRRLRRLRAVGDDVAVVQRVPTSTTDPQFGLDTGFYLFGLPFYTSVLGFASAVVLVCLLLTAVVSYLYGSVRVWASASCASPRPLGIQLAILAGLYLLLQGASLWLDRFTTLINQEDRITGPGYVGVNAVIPGQTILAIAAVIVALAFFVTAFIGRWRYPLIATALLVVSAIVVGAAIPWGGQHLPGASEPARAREPVLPAQHRQHEGRVRHRQRQKENFEATTTAQAGQLRNDAASTAQLRIMDPAIISPTVRQLEQYRAYYQFGNRSTSTATRSTGRARTRSSPCAN